MAQRCQVPGSAKGTGIVTLPLPICPHCEDRIGVYEPTVVIEPEGTRITSLAREPEIRDSAGVVLHARCAAEAHGDRDLLQPHL